MKFPGFESLYVAHEAPGSRDFVARLHWPVPVTHQSQVPRSLLTNVPPRPASVAASWAYGRATPGDVVCHDFSLCPIVSPRFIRALMDAGITGWDTLPCELSGREGEPHAGYALLLIHGRAGAVEDPRSEWLMEVRQGHEYAFMRGLYFDPATWDGCDMVLSRDGIVFFTERVREVLRRGRFRGFSLERATEVKRPIMPPTLDTFH